MSKHKARESWLQQACDLLRPLFKEATHGRDDLIFTDYPKLRVSCGWPKGGRGRSIGQCWSSDKSADEHFELFISPELEEPERILDVLAHELVHAVVGCECGHRGPFRKLAKAIGLEGKMTATIAGEQLSSRLRLMAHKLGRYPGARLRRPFAAQSTRMLKMQCSSNDGCECVVRMTRKWLDEVGPPTCGCGESMMEA